MNKALIVAISSAFISIQAPAVYAQIPASTLALHYVEGKTSSNKNIESSTQGQENSSNIQKEENAQEASDATEQVSGKNMSEELTYWVQLEKSQPKHRLYRLR